MSLFLLSSFLNSAQWCQSSMGDGGYIPQKCDTIPPIQLVYRVGKNVPTTCDGSTVTCVVVDYTWRVKGFPTRKSSKPYYFPPRAKPEWELPTGKYYIGNWEVLLGSITLIPRPKASVLKIINLRLTDFLSVVSEGT